MSISTNHTTDTLTPSSGTAKVAGVVESTTGGFKFPDGTTQTSSLTAGKAIAIGRRAVIL